MRCDRGDDRVAWTIGHNTDNCVVFVFLSNSNTKWVLEKFDSKEGAKKKKYLRITETVWVRRWFGIGRGRIRTVRWGLSRIDSYLLLWLLLWGLRLLLRWLLLLLLDGFVCHREQETVVYVDGYALDTSSWCRWFEKFFFFIIKR